MADNQTTKQSATIPYNAPRPVNIGDVFYAIDRADNAHFYEPCRVCGGARTLTVNGVTFACPCCDKEATTITIGKYIVKRFRVYAIRHETLTNDWKLSTYRGVSFSFYRKVGNGSVSSWFSNARGGDFTVRDDEFTKRYNAPYDVEKSADRNTCGIYDDYQLAIKVADAVNAAELQKLAEYNAKNGTSHVAQFKDVTHDPKSN